MASQRADEGRSTIAYSADSHIVEPAQLFASLERQFGERAPRIVHDPDWGDFLVAPGVSGREAFSARYAGIPVGRLGVAGANLDDPEVQQQIKRGYSGLRPGIVDPVERLRDQDADGVGLEVLFPSLYFRVFGLPDTEVLLAAFRAYNDWIADYMSQAPDRLIGLALIPMQDPAAAIVELDRVLKLGFRGGCIPCTAPGGRPYHDAAYDAVWARAQEARFPLSMHIFTGANEGVSGMRDLDAITSYASAATVIQITVSDLICQGVAQRFPELKFVCAEWETGWLAHWLERLDHAFYRSRNAAVADLDLKPTEYWRRQFYATFEDDRIGVQTREMIGVNTLMWGNDFPHHDSIWPNSVEILDDIFEGVPAAERRAMTAGNLAALYGLPPSP
jgi:predicted TIM-barrel fold metal-dependent hydrolase